MVILLKKEKFDRRKYLKVLGALAVSAGHDAILSVFTEP